MVLCMVGTGMLWVGWYGFNAGSAVAADGVAANAFMTTTLATAVAAFVWPTLEFMLKGKPSILGYCSGAVAGLVVVTPACGYVDATGAIVIGVCAAAIPFFFVVKVKAWFGYDDALDTFGVHAVGGTMGALLTGFLAVPAKTADGGMANPDAVNGNLAASVDKYIYAHSLWLEQLKAIGVTAGAGRGGDGGPRLSAKGAHGSASDRGRRRHGPGHHRSRRGRLPRRFQRRLRPHGRRASERGSPAADVVGGSEHYQRLEDQGIGETKPVAGGKGTGSGFKGRGSEAVRGRRGQRTASIFLD